MVCICLWHRCGYKSPIWVISNGLSFEKFFFWRFLLIHCGSASSFPSSPTSCLQFSHLGLQKGGSMQRVESEGPFRWLSRRAFSLPPSSLSISPVKAGLGAELWQTLGSAHLCLAFRNTRSRNALSLLFAPCSYY